SPSLSLSPLSFSPLSLSPPSISSLFLSLPSMVRVWRRLRESILSASDDQPSVESYLRHTQFLTVPLFYLNALYLSQSPLLASRPLVNDGR
ncbi:hypothetical protein PENTCL1PPCAC_14068, partial [Pristionchus entomophagus]